MADYHPLLVGIQQLLESRLSFRKRHLIDNIQTITSNFVKAGHNGGGRAGFVIAQTFEEEARVRAEIIIIELRESRNSWSSKQLTDAEHELRTTITDLFKTNLFEAAMLAKQIGGLQSATMQTLPAVLQSFHDYSDAASKTAMLMVDAIISEIISAAKNDMSAQNAHEKPAYIFQNTFHAPITSFAQGTVSIGEINQSSESPSLQEIADVVSKILNAFPKNQNETSINESKERFKTIESDLRDGKAPFAKIMGAIDIFRKTEDIAIKAPTVVEHVKQLATFMGII